MHQFNCEFERADGWKCLRPISQPGFCREHKDGKSKRKEQADKPQLRIEIEEQQRAKILKVILESLSVMGFSKTISALTDSIKTTTARFLEE